MENILVIRFGSLGDVILALPAMEALRRNAAHARISISVKEEYCSLFTGESCVDRVFPFSATGEHRGLPGFRRYARLLRRECFDLVVDLHGSTRSRALTCLLGQGQVWRVSLHHVRRQALVRFKKPVGGYPGHVVDRYLATVRSRGGAGISRTPRLSVPEQTRALVGRMLEGRGARGPGRLAALAPGAGRATKRWPPDRYAALGRRLADERSTQVAVIGSEPEAALVHRVVDLAGSERVFPFVSSDLMKQGALLSSATSLATNDSGLMHLSVAVGTPVAALFGPTTPSLGFYPLGKDDQILSVPLRCRPCSLHGLDECPRGDLACLERIPVAPVFRAMTSREGDRV